MTRPLVLSLNPALDVEWRVDGFRAEEKNSILTETWWAGGKGVNFARWFNHLGGKRNKSCNNCYKNWSTGLLLLPLGGRTGDELAGCLRAEKAPAHILRLHEPTRANVVLTAPDGRQMRFNHAGPKLSRREAGRILQVVRQNLTRCDLLILSGSLPRGIPATAYAGLIRLAHRHGVKTLLDCDGAAFAAAVKAHPFLVKPNEQELAQWRGRVLRTEAAVARAARELSEATRGWVLVSRGANAGLLVNAAKKVRLRALPPRVASRNRLGAGDAFLAGAAYQIGVGAPPEAWLRHALASGAAATQCVPGTLPKPALLTKLLRKVRAS